MKQAVIYTRFSPRPNAQECDSCEKQEERCRVYCDRHGYEIVAVYSDKAVTGRVFDRPGLQDALSSLKPGMVLLVDVNDRMARDMLVALTIRFEVERTGATLEFADGSPGYSTPEGELFQNIMSAFAAYERSRFARRTKAGLAKKKARGEWHGKVPVGYRVEGKRLVEHPGEQLAIRKARELRDHGWNSEVIADLLTQTIGLCRGKPWNERTVRRMLARDPLAA